MKRQAVVAALLLGLVAAGISASDLSANPPFARKGVSGGGGGGGSAQACDGGSSVCAQFENGQAFVTWDDLATGATGNNYRYKLYRSTSPITSGNYGSATLIASEILNNSGQLFGGTVNQTGAAFNQTNRQSNDDADGEDQRSGGRHDDADLRQGAAGLHRDRDAERLLRGRRGGVRVERMPQRRDRRHGQLYRLGRPDRRERRHPDVRSCIPTQPRGTARSFRPRASSSISICTSRRAAAAAPLYCGVGDYWQWWLTTAEGWQDGRATTLNVLQDNGAHYLGTPSSIEVTTRDTIWNPLGAAGMETNHQGQGLTPNPLVGTANRWYPTTMNGIARMLSFVVSNYGVDTNQVHCTGVSMGAWGCANYRPESNQPALLDGMDGHPLLAYGSHEHRLLAGPELDIARCRSRRRSGPRRARLGARHRPC